MECAGIQLYIDDILVKSIYLVDHSKNLKETPDIVRVYGMRLNSIKHRST